MHEVPFHVLGIHLKLRTEDNPEKLQRAILLLERKIDEIREITGIEDALRLALLAGLKLSEEALDRSSAPSSWDEIAKGWIDCIDKVL